MLTNKLVVVVVVGGGVALFQINFVEKRNSKTECIVLHILSRNTTKYKNLYPSPASPAINTFIRLRLSSVKTSYPWQHKNTKTTERSIQVVTRKSLHQMRYSRTVSPLADSVNRNPRRVVTYTKFIWIIETQLITAEAAEVGRFSLFFLPYCSFPFHLRIICKNVHVRRRHICCKNWAMSSKCASQTVDPALRQHTTKPPAMYVIKCYKLSANSVIKFYWWSPQLYVIFYDGNNKDLQ
jgi:hypothetical protein